jgi:hypothetical protein
MSVGNLGPTPQQQYDAMMAAADAFTSNANVNLNQVNRQPTDCQKLEAIILAATSLYNTYCNI